MYKKIITLILIHTHLIYTSDRQTLQSLIQQNILQISQFSRETSDSKKNSLEYLNQKHDIFFNFLKTVSQFEESATDSYVTHIKRHFLEVKEKIDLKRKDPTSLWDILEPSDNLYSGTQKIEDRLKQLSLSANMYVFQSALQALNEHFNKKYHPFMFASLIDHELALQWLKDQDPTGKNLEIQSKAQFALESIHGKASYTTQEIEDKVELSLKRYLSVFPYCLQSKFAKNINGEVVHDKKNNDIKNKYSLGIYTSDNSEIKYTARINLAGLEEVPVYQLIVKKCGNVSWKRKIPLVESNWNGKEPIVYYVDVKANGMCSIIYGSPYPPAEDSVMFCQYITGSGLALQPYSI